MRRYKKSDIETHVIGYGGRALPAVNVKVHFPREFYSGEMARQVEDDSGEEGFAEWWAEHEDDIEWTFAAACESEMETFELWENSGDPEYGPAFPDYSGRLKLWLEGRSGGWLVVEGLPDIDEWDAVMVARWAKFERTARSFADGVPYSMMMLAAINNYASERAEAERREEMAAAINADAEAGYAHA